MRQGLFVIAAAAMLMSANVALASGSGASAGAATASSVRKPGEIYHYSGSRKPALIRSITSGQDRITAGDPQMIARIPAQSGGGVNRVLGQQDRERALFEELAAKARQDAQGSASSAVAGTSSMQRRLVATLDATAVGRPIIMPGMIRDGRPTPISIRKKPPVLFSRANFQVEIARAVRDHGVDEALVRTIIHVESAYKPRAVSRVGATGLMQLMPATARRFGVSDRYDPVQNIDGGTRYLAWLLNRYNGDITLAAAAYNAGEGAVDRHGGVPPYKETRNYVRKVAELLPYYRSLIHT